jgi:hypothetical protein
MEQKQDHYELTKGNVRVSLIHAVLIPLMIVSFYLLLTTPKPIQSILLIFLIFGAAGPPVLFVIIVGLSTRRQRFELEKHLQLNDFLIADTEQSKLVLDDFKDVTTPRDRLGISIIQCWISSDTVSPQYFIEFRQGAGKRARKKFAIMMSVASSPKFTYWFRTDSAHKLAHSSLVPSSGPIKVAQNWVILAPPDVTRTMFTKDLYEVLNAFPLEENPTWIWLRNQLWLVSPGSLTALGLQTCFEHVASVAQVAGITRDDHAFWSSDSQHPQQEEPS